MLVLFVAYGWGVARNSLGQRQWRNVLFAGAIYAAVALSNGLLASRPFSAEQSDFHSTLRAAETFLDAVFFLWIFDRLMAIKQFMHDKGESHKSELFNWFASVLFALCAFSFDESVRDQLRHQAALAY